MRTPRVAVVGSRTFKDIKYLERILEEITAFIGEFVVVSGGAEGADTLAVQWSEARGGYPTVYPAAWGDLSHPDAVIKTNKHGKQYDALAGYRRNQQIVDDCDLVVAFWDGKSPGTADTIARAEKAGVPVHVFWNEE